MDWKTVAKILTPAAAGGGLAVGVFGRPQGSDVVVQQLDKWGAEPFPNDAGEPDPWQAAIDERGETVGIDFFTPFPGDQPIASSIQMQDGEIVEATIRYGVLEPVPFGEDHPTDSTVKLERLHRTIRDAWGPLEGKMLANYGDPNRQPRPHLLLGWEPSMAEYPEFLRDGDAHDTFNARQTMRRIIRVGEAIREEFDGKWVGQSSSSSRS